VVLESARDKKNKRLPAISSFSLSDNDHGNLSVDWERKTTPEESIARFGASYKFGKKEYKPYENRAIYALDISFLNSLSDVEGVIYDPIFYSQPVKGRVNNPAHSLIRFNLALEENGINDPETLLKIRDHAAKQKVSYDLEKVHAMVDKLRNKVSEN